MKISLFVFAKLLLAQNGLSSLFSFSLRDGVVVSTVSAGHDDNAADQQKKQED